MITSAQNYPISKIFDMEIDIVYEIPKYQREYVWKKERYEALFDDILDNDSGHFLGSIICINKNADALQQTKLEVIDGQQRLTTISLLYAALYNWLKLNLDNNDEDINNEIINLKYRLISKIDKKSVKLEPSFQSKNNQDYRKILEDIGLLKDVENISNSGNRKIFKTFRYFVDRLNIVNENNFKEFDEVKILEFLNKINSATLVKIEVGNNSDAFILFETLNDRGEPLTALDLIKNKLLAELEKQKLQSLDENFKKWNQLLENLSEDSNIQLRFLRHYYNSFKYKEEVKVKNFNMATRSNLMKIYSILIETDPNLIFNDLHEKSKIYNRIIDPKNNDKNSSEITKSLLELERIGGVPSHAFLLFIMSENNLSDEELKDIIDLLVKYFVRRNLTDTPPTRDMDRIIVDLIEFIREDKPNFNHISNFLKNSVRISSDEIFKSKLCGNIYEDNVGVCRFILCKIEEMNNKTKEIYTNLWEIGENKKNVWTIEHVFPKGNNIPNCWIQMIANGDSEKALEYKDKFVNKLGNLTLSGYNSNLGNLCFSEKKERKDKNGNEIGYKNGLFLNVDLVKKDNWTIEDIKNRTNSLVELALELFKF